MDKILCDYSSMQRGTRRALVLCACLAIGSAVMGCGEDAEVIARQVRDYVAGVTTSDGRAQGTLVEGVPPEPNGGPAPAVTSNGEPPAAGGESRATVSADVPFATVLLAVKGAEDYFELALPEAVGEAEIVVTLASDVPDSSFELQYAVIFDGLVGPFADVRVDLGEILLPGDGGEADAGGEPEPDDSAFVLACAWWDGVNERVDVVDPETGAASYVGNLGDLEQWGLQFVVDRTGTLAHAIGGYDDGTGRQNLYTLDLTTGRSTQVPVDRAYALVGTTTDGRVLASPQGPTSSTMSIVSLDPTSGAATSLGTLGPAARWGTDVNGWLAIRHDRARARVYAVSWSGEPASTEALHILDIESGEVTTQAVSGRSGQFIAAGVRANGELVGMFHDSAPPFTWSMVTVDPATGMVSAPIAISGLESSGGRATFDPFAQVAYTVSSTEAGTLLLHRVDIAARSSSSVGISSCIPAIY